MPARVSGRASSGGRRRRFILVVLGLMIGSACSGSDDVAVDPAELQAAVDSLLRTSAAAWNGGDLDGFLLWYQRGAETTFIGSAGLLHGWEAIRQRYAPTFEPGAVRDSLRFEGLETRVLGGAYGLATARYVLFRGDSTTSTGAFTLVLEETPQGWRIIHDHSSALSN